MQSIQRTLGMCVFMLAGTAFAASTQPVKANEPAYSSGSVVDVYGIVAGVRQAPAGSALEGTHLTVKTKAGMIDVYLAPADFLRMLKTNIAIGNEVEVQGSKVKSENGDVILTRELSVGSAVIDLRDASGAPDWKNWGVEIDPSAVHY
jgi:hypothetical protein